MGASYQRRVNEIAALERANENLRLQALVMAKGILAHGKVSAQPMRGAAAVVAREVCGMPVVAPRQLSIPETPETKKGKKTSLSMRKPEHMKAFVDGYIRQAAR